MRSAVGSELNMLNMWVRVASSTRNLRETLCVAWLLPQRTSRSMFDRAAFVDY